MKKGEKKMKKNIEWLKKEIATEMIELEPIRRERWADVKYQTLRDVAQKLDQLDEPEALSKEESINIVLDDLKEYIKEQQSLSQNVGLAHTSAGNDTHYRQYDYVLECVNEYEPSDDLQNLLIPKQEVLSQEWIDKNVVHVRGLGDIFEAETVENLLVPKQGLPVIPKYVADWITKHRDTFDLYPMLKRLEKNSSTWELTYKWYRTNTHEFVNAYLTGEYEVEEEPLYHALIKGHELLADEDAWACNYWNLSVLDGRVFPSDKSSSDGLFSTKMTKSKWNKVGINDSNADFVKVEENE